MDPTVSIGYLADYLEWADTLADWHWNEWGHLTPSWTREMARSELNAHTQRRRIPTTLVAHEGDMLLGSVSLEVFDLEEIRHLTPWLTSLWVAPLARQRGIGTQLTLRVMEEAQALRVPQLYLLTLEHTAFYRRLGWRKHPEVGIVGEMAFEILTIDLLDHVGEKRPLSNGRAQGRSV